MSRLHTGAALLWVLFVSLGCPGKNATGNDDGGQPELKADMGKVFARAPAFADAAERLITAAQGGPANGVTLTQSGNVVTAVVKVDVDGDGVRETDITGTATFSAGLISFDDGAIVSFDAPSGIESHATGNVMTLGGVAYANTIAGSFASGADGTRTVLTEGNLSADPSTGLILGAVDFEVLGNSDAVRGTIHFEDDGQGGWHLRITGRNDSFEFFVP